jgi:hypothetical protein
MGVPICLPCSLAASCTETLSHSKPSTVSARAYQYRFPKVVPTLGYSVTKSARVQRVVAFWGRAGDLLAQPRSHLQKGWT